MPPSIFICGRRRRPKCFTCKGDDAGLLCDGCDKPLCAPCSVSPRTGKDFCSSCARPVFEGWCGTAEGRDWGRVPEGRTPAAHRQLRRNAFRAWARANPDAFTYLRDPPTP